MIAENVAATAAATGKNGKLAALRHAGMFVCLLLLVSAMGCAPKLYNVNMRYQPTKAIPPAVTDGRKFSLTVATFIDRRKMEDTLLIGRVDPFRRLLHPDPAEIRQGGRTRWRRPCASF